MLPARSGGNFVSGVVFKAAPVVVCDEVNEEDAVHQVDKVDEVHQVHQVDLAHQVNKVDEVHQVHPLDPVHQNTS